jgi:hypothetical protein
MASKSALGIPDRRQTDLDIPHYMPGLTRRVTANDGRGRLDEAQTSMRACKLSRHIRSALSSVCAACVDEHVTASFYIARHLPNNREQNEENFRSG